MPPETPRRWDAWTRAAVAAWFLILAAVGARAVVQPRDHSLYRTFAEAGRDWLDGADAYARDWEPNRDLYRYSPAVSVCFVPLGLLPERVGGVLWRLFNGAVFLGAAAWWLRSAAPAPLSVTRRAVWFLLLAPLALASLNNGQTNPLVLGLMLGSLAAASGRRWTLAAFLVAGACALKVYPLALGLLLAAAYPRRFAGRLALALGAVAALPFLFQDPDYVAGQYRRWVSFLGADDRRAWPLHMTYRDLWLLFRAWGVPLEPRLYLGVQLLSAAGAAMVCVAARWRGWPAREVLMAALTLGTCWMILCGPATESSTYILLAPALTWALVSGWGERWWPGLACVPALAGFGLLLVCVLAGLFRNTAAFHGLGLQPLGALVFAAGSGVTLLNRLIGPEQRGTPAAAVTARAA